MRPLAEIERALDAIDPARPGAPEVLLAIGEEVLEAWVAARGEAPTREASEGFRLLALHRQGARGAPSFNACRETCRELAYHYNLLRLAPADAQSGARRRMMLMLARHLALFVGGKMQQDRLGEFCCAARPVRARDAAQAD